MLFFLDDDRTKTEKMKSDRRSFLKSAGITGMSLTSSFSFGVPAYLNQKESQADPDVAAQLESLNRFPRMVQEYLTARIREIEKTSNERRQALRSKGDAEDYVRDVRAKIQQCFGPWPEKTPLNARITGVIERDTYQIEKVIFESRPEFPVTANLYLPKGRNFPLPAVVGTCGHSNSGKAEPAYQSFAQGLARQGYMVLIYDPIGQGERIQYLTGDNKSRYGIGVQEHLQAGNQMFLTGGSLHTWFAWDGIRAVDYLLSRPEVDPEYLGVTGNSGGGTQTTWLCGVESRFTMAAPSCFVTTFLHNMENELPADTEQCPRGALQLGLDHSDFIAAMAPKPVILLGQEKDFFDVRGLEESFMRLKQLYRLLGAEENIQLFIGSGYHGYSQENREAMYNCFNRVTKKPEVKAEPSLTLETEETLRCTVNGQVGKSGARTVFSFTGQVSAALKKERKSLHQKELKQTVIKMLRLPLTKGVPDFRILRPVNERFYPRKYASSYAVETEPGICALVYRIDDNPLYSRPPEGAKRAILYVSHLSADDELRKETLLKELIAGEPDSAVFACDVRGIGESKPNTCGMNFDAPYGSDYFYAVHSIMLDYPYVAQKTYDVLRVIDWIKSIGHKEIHLVGKGRGSIPATFAALLLDAVVQVTLKNALVSYSDIAEHEDYTWPLSTLLPGVLKTFDLPDCYQALEEKKLHLIEPWNASQHV